MSRTHTLNRVSRRYKLNTISTIIHPTVVNWSQRTITNGAASLPSSTTLSAASDFCYSLDTANLTSLMLAVNIFAPDNLSASITPLIKVAGNDPWTNTAFVVSDLNSDGLKGDGGSKWLNIGINPSVTFAGPLSASAGITVYSTFSDANGGGGDCVTVDGSYAFNLWSDNAGNTIFDCFTNVTNRLSCISLANSLGYTSANRVSMTNQSVYQANSAISHFLAGFSSLGPGTVLPNRSMPAFCWNDSGTIHNFSLKRFSFAAVHLGLTLDQSNSFFNAVQLLRQNIGGGWL